MVNQQTQKGSAFIIIVVILTLAIIGVFGFLFWQNYASQDPQANSDETTMPQEATIETPDPNEGYLVVGEWGLRFKVPDEIDSIEYRVREERVDFYAKPAGYDVKYVDVYDALREDQDAAKYALGVLYRFNDETLSPLGFPVKGKKLGDYYYYTLWSFSRLGTGAALQGIYTSNECKNYAVSSMCNEKLSGAEAKAFNSTNELLRSIELVES